MSDFTRNHVSFPYKYQVVIGPDWNFGNVHFIEDEVITLTLCKEYSSNYQLVYSEMGDGILSSINRLQLIHDAQNITDGNTLDISAYSAYVERGVDGYFTHSDTDINYTFEELFSHSPSLTPTSIDENPSIFEMTAELNGGLFKSMTAIVAMNQASFYPGASGDDGWANSSTFSNSSNSLIIGNTGGEDHEIFIRFPNVTIPHNATILRAFLRGVAYASNSLIDTVDIKLYCVDDDNPLSPANLSEFNALSLTSYSQNVIQSDFIDGVAYIPDSGSLNLDPFQEVVSRPGWSSGNALIVVLKKYIYNTDEYQQISSIDYASGSEKVELVIDWVDFMAESVTESVDFIDSATGKETGMHCSIVEYAHFSEVQTGLLTMDVVNSESLIMSESDVGNIVNMGNTINESITISDAIIIKWLESIADSIGISDSTSNKLGLLISEVLSMIDHQSNNWNGSESVHDSVSIFDSPVLIKWCADTISDVLDVVDESTWKLYLQIVETISLLDLPVANWQGALQINSGIGMIDDPRVIKILSDVVEESITIQDALTDLFRILVSEVLSLIDSQSNNWNGSHVISEALAMADIASLAGIVSAVIDESITIEDAVQKVLGLIVDEVVALIDSQSNNWSGSEILSESLDIRESFISLFKIISDSIDEGVSFTDAVSPVLGLFIADVISCSSTAEAIGQFSRQINDQMILTDEALRAWNQVIEEVISITEASQAVKYMNDVIDESIQALDGAVNGLTVPRTISESISFTEDITILSVLKSVIEEVLNLAVTIELNGEVWECWALNTGKFHPSIYTNFNFNSYAMYQGILYGCKNDGIYELVGTTDDGTDISTSVVLPLSNFGSSMEKRFRKAWLGISGTSPSLKVETENGDMETYSLDSNKTTISRSLRGKKWAFTANNFDSLNFIELMPIVLKRY